MSKSIGIFLAMGFAGIGCAILFNYIGSTIDTDGTLREPFFLVPIGYFLVFVGFGSAAILALIRRLRKFRQDPS